MPQTRMPLAGVTPLSETPAAAPDTPDDVVLTQMQSPADFMAACILTPPQAPDELGRLGGYRILRIIGEGGMGVVYEAEDETLKRRVAMKVMKPEIAAKPEARGRFLREARAAAALLDDHVVLIFQVGEERRVPFLVMPLMKGETLHDRLKRERLSLAEAVRVGRETAQGLAAAHAAGLIHRDIKPANLWLEAPRGRVKVLDFGLARLEQGYERYTRTGQVLGTPSFMSPEQARGQTLDSRADLFSLGCVLYLLTTGHKPFQGDDELAILCSLAMDHPPPPHELNPEVPAALADLILRLLAKEPDDRPASAAEVVVKLLEIEAHSAGSLSSSRPAVFAAPPALGKPGPGPKAPDRAGLGALVGTSLDLGSAVLPAAWRKPAPPAHPHAPRSAGNTLTFDLGDGVTLECVRIPAGTFTMGSTDGFDDEKPTHPVTIAKPFYLGQLAVTVGQFRRFVEEAGHRTEAEADYRGGWGVTAAGGWVRKSEYNWEHTGWSQTDDHPVVNVSWYDAAAFCDWLARTSGAKVVLPTEAEWEYSCRAGSATEYHFGNDPEGLSGFGNVADAAAKRRFRGWTAITADDGFIFTAPAGQFRPNRFGMYDMHGNVWEWCRDGKRAYTSRAETNPVGPLAPGGARVNRGGSFSNGPRLCRSADRNCSPPSSRGGNLGFRVAVVVS